MIHTVSIIGEPAIIISDTHIPYSHFEYMDFLRAVKKFFKIKRNFFHIGDELDYHAISFHTSESSLMNPDRELEESIEELRNGLIKSFPKLKLLTSNHGSLIHRRLTAGGIPLEVLKPLDQLYNAPQWSWHDEIKLMTNLGPVLLVHGKSAAYGKMCKEEGMSCIQGHFHGKFEITWHETNNQSKFNAFTGCLVDYESMAMAYGRNNLPRPILGCIVLLATGMPVLVKMNLDKKGRWTRVI